VWTKENFRKQALKTSEGLADTDKQNYPKSEIPLEFLKQGRQVVPEASRNANNA